MNERRALPLVQDPITTLPGVGKGRAEVLAKLGIKTIDDLLRHYPRRYEDRRWPVAVCDLPCGEAALARVRVRRVIPAPMYKRGDRSSRVPMKVICGDDTGELTLLFFNARWLSRAFREGEEYWVYGTPRRELFGVSMAHPDFEIIVSGPEEDEAGRAGKTAFNGAGIVPVYPLTAGVTQKYMRGLIFAAIPAAERMGGVLPESLAAKRRLAPASYALSHIHFPEDEHALNASRYCLVYEELFLLQLRLLHARASAGSSEKGESTCADWLTANDAASLFPFTITGAQYRAIEEIRLDMAGRAPMHRLLQGDVGSGKTAVCAAAAMFAAKSGFQTAVMAPTEILASQHADEFERIFSGKGIKTALLTSGLTPMKKREVKSGLASGEIHVAIGTHALIEPDVSFLRLGLVVTDEQHRFGVRQRLMLREKGASPDTLVMTATPIPRTLALMLYADLDVSVLDEMPPGRRPVTTRFVGSSKRDAVYDFAEKEMAAGRQTYVVAPMIGDDEYCAGDDENGSVNGGDRLNSQPASALELAEELTARFPHRRVAALHGRMKGGQKEETMRAFVAGEIDMLVSTVVIEVGVNVPNATVMIVENAERFGLAQLHQLRGRVGRGAEKSYCVLISDSESELSVKRCEYLAREHDGFKIAEHDLLLRGPGDLFGIRQHGLPELKIADPAKHFEILRLTNEDARELLTRDPNLELPEHRALRGVVGEGSFS